MLPRILLLLLSLSFLSSCGYLARGLQTGWKDFSNSQLFHQGRHGELTETEKKWAKAAWKYFINNYNPHTGLVNGMQNFPVSSVWNIADTLAATVAAHRLALIDDYEFDQRISALLGFLNTMGLSFGKLPNKYYHAENGSMSNVAGQTGDAGWSAVDIGRLLIWLQILAGYAPHYTEYIDKAILRWRFCEIIDDCGQLYGSFNNSGQLSLYPNMPLGYEDYALMGFGAWGFNRPAKRKYSEERVVKIHDIPIPVGHEDPRVTGRYHPVVSTPFLLLGLEFNWDQPTDYSLDDQVHTDDFMAELAEKIYRVQAARHREDRIFTARADHQLNREPYFIYDTLFAAGFAWNTLSANGDFKPDEALVSIRAVFPMWALWKTAYTDALMELMDTLYDSEKGWFEGRLERTGKHERTLSCTTNALVLEALMYKVHGKLYRVTEPHSYADIVLEDEFLRPKCSPPEQENCPVK